MSTQEKKSWHAAASKRELSVSNYLRFLANTDDPEVTKVAELTSRPPPRKKPVNRRPAEPVDPRLIKAVNAVGGNINQIARHLNNNNDISLEVLHTLTQMSRALDRIADAGEQLATAARQEEKKELPE